MVVVDIPVYEMSIVAITVLAMLALSFIQKDHLPNFFSKQKAKRPRNRDRLNRSRPSSSDTQNVQSTNENQQFAQRPVQIAGEPRRGEFQQPPPPPNSATVQFGQPSVYLHPSPYNDSTSDGAPLPPTVNPEFLRSMNLPMDFGREVNVGMYPTPPLTPSLFGDVHLTHMDEKKEHVDSRAIVPEVDPTNIPEAPSMSMSVGIDVEPLARVIIVTYKLPLSVQKNDKGKWVVEWDSTRNFMTNYQHVDSHEVFYVGWPRCEEPKDFDEREELEHVLMEHNVYPVFLDANLKANFDKCCQTVLWPLFHYQMPTNDQTFGDDFEHLWQTYSSVNLVFSKKALVATEDYGSALIWFQNYHMLLAPHLLRRTRPDVSIGLFVHTIFPTSEVFRCLPSRREILRGMLAADLIGFHTYDYCRHFLSACKRLLDLDFQTHAREGALSVSMSGRDIVLQISHVSVLSQEIQQTVLSDRVSEIADLKWKSQYTDKKIVVGMGEFAVVRGTGLAIRAFDRFLETYPGWKDNIIFIQVMKRSYNVHANEMEEVRGISHELVNDLRRKYGVEFIDMCESELSIEELFALYSVADVVLFPTFWDGFNTSPYEVTICQSGRDMPAAIILSEFMGCHRALAGALQVNPWRLEEVSEALHNALVMTAHERQLSHARRYKYVMNYTFVDWAESFITDLISAASSKDNKHAIGLGVGSHFRLIYLPNQFRALKEVQSILLAGYKEAKRRVLFFDYGGTLAVVNERNPMISTQTRSSRDLMRISRLLVKPDSVILSYLKSLSEHPETLVCVISGHRPEEIADAFQGCDSILLAAEKGAFIRYPGASEFRMWEAIGDTAEWMSIAEKILRTYTRRTDGSWIDKKSTALVWHYHQADPEFGEMQALEVERYLKRVLEPYKVEVLRYQHSKILEVLPVRCNKGAAVQNILSSIRLELAQKHVDFKDLFISAIGNDTSDESMFEICEEFAKEVSSERVFTCTIGIKPTAAKYYFTQQNEVGWLLNCLSGMQWHELLSFQQNQIQNQAKHAVFHTPVANDVHYIPKSSPPLTGQRRSLSLSSGNLQQLTQSVNYQSPRSVYPPIDPGVDENMRRHSVTKPRQVNPAFTQSAPGLPTMPPAGFETRNAVRANLNTATNHITTSDAMNPLASNGGVRDGTSPLTSPVFSKRIPSQV